MNSCSLDEFEESAATDREIEYRMGGLTSSDDDPFITGRFCDNNGK
jgi:hypothetical protein